MCVRACVCVCVCHCALSGLADRVMAQLLSEMDGLQERVGVVVSHVNTCMYHHARWLRYLLLIPAWCAAPWAHVHLHARALRGLLLCMQVPAFSLVNALCSAVCVSFSLSLYVCVCVCVCV